MGVEMLFRFQSHLVRQKSCVVKSTLKKSKLPVKYSAVLLNLYLKGICKRRQYQRADGAEMIAMETVDVSFVKPQ